MRRLIYFILTILLCGCNNSINLIDYYWVYPEDEFGNGYYLICKLSSEDDPKIENIKSVFWNEKYIIIEQNISSKYNWLIIEAKNKKLKCGCGDKILGHFEECYIKKFINSTKMDFHKRTF